MSPEELDNHKKELRKDQNQNKRRREENLTNEEKEIKRVASNARDRKYYVKNKEDISAKRRENYANKSEAEKQIRREKDRERYHNSPDTKRRKLEDMRKRRAN